MAFQLTEPATWGMTPTQLLPLARQLLIMVRTDRSILLGLCCVFPDATNTQWLLLLWRKHIAKEDKQ